MRSFAAVLPAGCGLALWAFCCAASAEEAQVVDGIAAIVNGDVIDSATARDALAQSGAEALAPVGPDHVREAANAAWKAISQNGLPCAQVFQEIEKRVLEAAIRADGSTRRQIAKRLHTSERTLYYKMRAHGINHPAA